MGVLLGAGWAVKGLLQSLHGVAPGHSSPLREGRVIDPISGTGKEAGVELVKCLSPICDYPLPAPCCG